MLKGVTYPEVGGPRWSTFRDVKPKKRKRRSKRKKPVRLTPFQILEIRDQLKRGIPAKNILRYYDISKTILDRIRQGTHCLAMKIETVEPKSKPTPTAFKRDKEFEKRFTEYVKKMEGECKKQLQDAKKHGLEAGLLNRTLVMLSETTFPKVMVLKAFLEVGNE